MVEVARAFWNGLLLPTGSPHARPALPPWSATPPPVFAALSDRNGLVISRKIRVLQRDGGQLIRHLTHANAHLGRLRRSIALLVGEGIERVYRPPPGPGNAVHRLHQLTAPQDLLTFLGYGLAEMTPD